MKKGSLKKAKQSKIDAIMHDNYTGDDVKRYIGAVTEEFRGQVSAVAEQFLGLNEKVDQIDQKVSSLDQKVSSLDEKVSSLDEKVSSLDEKVDCLQNTSKTHTEMIGRLMTDVEEIKIGMLEKVSRQDFNKLESRLVALETIVFTERGKNVGRSAK